MDNRNASAFMKSRWIITRGELDWQSNPTGITLIVDDSDARFLTRYAQDPWRGYTEFGGQHFGSTHYYNRKTGTGQDLATWSFTVPEPGSYDLYAWWWAGGWRPSGVPYTIYHDRGVSTVRVDQKSHGGHWNLLGTFHFQDEGAVVVSDDVESGRDLTPSTINGARLRLE